MGIEVGGLFGLILLIANIYAIVKIIESSAPTFNKVLWSLFVFFAPVVGLICWYLFGPKGK